MTSMTAQRYGQLMRAEAELTEEEIKTGWHFCCEWDGLLIAPDWSEANCCKCFETQGGAA